MLKPSVLNAVNLRGAMMEIEKQVVSLELSKKLYEIGVMKISLFYWNEPYGKDFEPIITYGIEEGYGSNISAFTVAELGEMLPSAIIDSRYWLDIRNWGSFQLFYEDDIFHQAAHVEDEKEADARAKMIIYLLEQEIVKPSDLIRD